MRVLSVLVPILLLTACGGGSSSGGSSSTPPVAPVVPVVPVLESFTLVDPDESADHKFGKQTVELANGNIAVHSLYKSGGVDLGAVYLFNPLSKSLVHSFYGIAEYDLTFGVTLKALSNGNLVIAASYFKVNGEVKAGKVMLINGATGAQIGTAISGDNVGDELGSYGITELSNGNYVIASPGDKVNGNSQAGSVILVSGTTGAQIGSAIEGDWNADKMGSSSITALNNGNYVVASKDDSHGSSANNQQGSVILVNGSTGAIIGTPVNGSFSSERIGGGEILALANNNYVIASPEDRIGSVYSTSILSGGSAILVNGDTGAVIDTVMQGNAVNDRIGSAGLVALTNNEFAVVSSYDTVAGIVRAGSVAFFNGSTGAQLGSTIVGDNATDDRLGSGGVIQLSNGNIVISSPLTNGNGTDSGSVILVNGSKVVVSTVNGTSGSQYSSSGVKALSNGNYVTGSGFEDAPLKTNAGGVHIHDGSSNVALFNIQGETGYDVLSSSGLHVLENDNIVVASEYARLNGDVDVGSVMLIKGADGTQVGSSITGNLDSDRLSSDGIVVLKGNNNFVISSSIVEVDGEASAGSVILVNGSTGAQMSVDTGNNASDQYGKDQGVKALANGSYTLSTTYNDDNGNTDVGGVFYRLGQ